MRRWKIAIMRQNFARVGNGRKAVVLGLQMEWEIKRFLLVIGVRNGWNLYFYTFKLVVQCVNAL